jgi:hypothetical protein
MIFLDYKSWALGGLTRAPGNWGALRTSGPMELSLSSWAFVDLHLGYVRYSRDAWGCPYADLRSPLAMICTCQCRLCFNRLHAQFSSTNRAPTSRE